MVAALQPQSSPEPANRFYLYRHIRKDTGEVFYIGKGKIGKKQKFVRAFDFSHRNRFWRFVADKCGGVDVEIIEEFETEERCFERERELIALYGRRSEGTGPLCNIAPGGEGLSGMKFTEEHKRKIGDAQRGKPKPFTEAGRLAHDKQKGQKLSPEHIQKMSDALRGQTRTAEQRANISASLKGHVLSEETKRKIGDKAVGRKASDEAKRKMSLAHLGRPLSEKNKRGLSEARIALGLKGEKSPWFGRKHTEETKRKMSASSRFNQPVAEE